MAEHGRAPHGIENGSDNFPDGDPGCRDCLEIARSLADKDVTCYTVACEPSVTRAYAYCRDFLAGLAEITGGMLVPLKSAAMLTDLILASCKEGADLAKALRVRAPSGRAVQGEQRSITAAVIITSTTCAATPTQSTVPKLLLLRENYEW